jgi:glutamyl-tRNA synthetase
MTPAPFKSRFAPSPTGLLHLGNVRTALFNWLAARRAGGVFLLRIEDTDATRGHEKYTEALQRDLRWLGLDWHEGPGAGGEHAPYVQSERAAVYARYFSALEGQGRVYPCFCTEHELEIARKTQIAAGRPPRYSGRCRALTPADIAERRARGLPATLRFRVPEGETVGFDDRVRGRQEFATADIGDFIVRRSDGTPAFFFCNAIDDALMGVSLVLRGEDHLTNTPRQILLLRTLGLPVPDYAHIALVVGSDNAPLSKRTGSKSVEDLRTLGYLPRAINNYLARLGHTYESNALLDLDTLAGGFDLSRLHKAPAHFDEQHLLHWQKEAIHHASTDELWRWMSDREYPDGRIENFVPPERGPEFVEAVRGNVTVPIDAFAWAGRLFTAGEFHTRESREAIRAASATFFTAARECAGANSVDFRAYAAAVTAATGARGKSLFMPLRAALTGVTHGPEMDRLWRLLGPDRIRQRLDAAIELCQHSR